MMKTYIGLHVKYVFIVRF